MSNWVHGRTTDVVADVVTWSQDKIFAGVQRLSVKLSARVVSGRVVLLNGIGVVLQVVVLREFVLACRARTISTRFAAVQGVLARAAFQNLSEALVPIRSVLRDTTRSERHSCPRSSRGIASQTVATFEVHFFIQDRLVVILAVRI